MKKTRKKSLEEQPPISVCEPLNHEYAYVFPLQKNESTREVLIRCQKCNHECWHKATRAQYDHLKRDEKAGTLR